MSSSNLLRSNSLANNLSIHCDMYRLTFLNCGKESPQKPIGWSHCAQNKSKTIYLLLLLVTPSCVTLWEPMTVASVPGILLARILDLGNHFLLQGIFLTQGLNPLLHCRWIVYCWATGKDPDQLEIQTGPLLTFFSVWGNYDSEKPYEKNESVC